MRQLRSQGGEEGERPVSKIEQMASASSSLLEPRWDYTHEHNNIMDLTQLTARILE